MPLPCAQLGDAEYFLVWDELLLPILREFKPDLVIVSAGMKVPAFFAIVPIPTEPSIA